MCFVVFYWYKGISVATVMIDGRDKFGTMEVQVQEMLGLCRPSYQECRKSNGM